MIHVNHFEWTVDNGKWLGSLCIKNWGSGGTAEAGIRSAQTLPLENVNAEIPQELQELENEAFLQIISGEKPVDYFDTFVVEWYANGGKELTEQVQNAYESGKD